MVRRRRGWPELVEHSNPPIYRFGSLQIEPIFSLFVELKTIRPPVTQCRQFLRYESDGEIDSRDNQAVLIRLEELEL